MSGAPTKSHMFQPGDWVYVKRHPQETLEPRWKGSSVILLRTPTAVKVDGIVSWIHYSHARPVDPFTLREEYRGEGWEVNRDPDNPLKLGV